MEVIIWALGFFLLGLYGLGLGGWCSFHLDPRGPGIFLLGVLLLLLVLRLAWESANRDVKELDRVIVWIAILMGSYYLVFFLAILFQTVLEDPDPLIVLEVVSFLIFIQGGVVFLTGTIRFRERFKENRCFPFSTALMAFGGFVLFVAMGVGVARNGYAIWGCSLMLFAFLLPVFWVFSKGGREW